jgi:thioredoxin reductase
MRHESLPVVIIGAGPVGLAAAAHARSRNLTPLVLEAGASVGAGIRQWGHVRMFSPWKFNVDAAASAILTRQGWSMPDGDDYPTGHDLVERYLEPLARCEALRPYVRTNARVAGVTRLGHDLMKDAARSEAPFVVRVVGPDGEADLLAQAVVDASGTTEYPGVLGAAGVPALGERALSGRIFYGIPDVLGKDRRRYANRRVLVAGSGHSALHALLDLATLAGQEPLTTIVWVVRRQTLGQLLGGSRADQLEERGRLGSRVRSLLDQGRVELIAGFGIDRIASTSDGLVVSAGNRSLSPVDEVIAATGFRPDWSILSEVRLDLDPALESPRALAPLIDPNVHSCGTVPPHGAEELKQPDANLFVIGMKSYGRAPTFLMLTGYEQARSVVSAIAGDWEAARRVELVLPETGVCSSDQSGAAPSRSTPAPACCDSVLLETCCEADAKPSCCGSSVAPKTCGCGAGDTVRREVA